MAQIYRIEKIGSALEQLDWAIKLLIDHAAYIPAITLAAAAEELFSRAPCVKVGALAELRDMLDAKHGLTGKTIVDDHLNRARNWLKHWSSTHTDTLEIDLETEAILYIVRGLTNAERAGAQRTNLAERFQTWGVENRPDLFNE